MKSLLGDKLPSLPYYTTCILGHNSAGCCAGTIASDSIYPRIRTKSAQHGQDNTLNKTLPSEMVFNKTKKKLEEERQLRQRLTNELAAQRRDNSLRQERMQQQHERNLERAAIEESLQQAQVREAHEREMWRVEQQLRNARIVQEELKRQEEEREEEFKRQEAERVRKEAEREKQEAERRYVELLNQERENQRLEREERERQKRQRKLMEASPETLRSLRELIREKYHLDIEIWGLRGTRKANHWIVEQKMEKADAVFAEIMDMVRMWEHQTDGAWDAAEWERVQDIRTRLQTGGVRIWADNPVWNDAQRSSGQRRGGRADRRVPTV